jgi:hypothetical protein
MNKVIMSISPHSDRTIAVELGGNLLARTNATSFLSVSSRSLVNSGNVATSSWLIFLHTDLLEKYTTFAFWPDKQSIEEDMYKDSIGDKIVYFSNKSVC